MEVVVKNYCFSISPSYFQPVTSSCEKLIIEIWEGNRFCEPTIILCSNSQRYENSSRVLRFAIYMYLRDILRELNLICITVSGNCISATHLKGSVVFSCFCRRFLLFLACSFLCVLGPLSYQALPSASSFPLLPLLISLRSQLVWSHLLSQ